MTVESSQSVIVVSGLPRSGTSMMMQMIAAGGLSVLTDQIRAADDDNLRGYFELESVKQTQQDARWLTDAPGKAVKVIYRLLEYLPDNYRYQVLFMDRPLAEVIASQQSMLRRRGTHGATVSNKQLETIFESELQRVKSWLDTRDNFDWIELQYGQILEDARSESERICRFLNVSLDVEAMAAKVNRELYRNRI